MMEYKGYFGNVTFDADNDLFHGEVVGIRDVVTFQGRSVEELRQAFHDSVDDYLEFCRQRGEPPEKPLSGRFVLRISPELHRRVYALATKEGQSLNSWIVSRLETEAGHPRSDSSKAEHGHRARKPKQTEKTKARRK